MPKETAYFVHDAETYRVRAGARITVMQELTRLSRSTIGRIESDAGVSEVSAWSYLRALKSLSHDYPHTAPFSRPKNAKVNIVKIPSDKLDSDR